MAEIPEGPPMHFRWRRALHTGRVEGPGTHRHGMVAASRVRVRRAIISGWRMNEGRRFWLYREGIYESETSAPRWFMHGLFA